MKRCVLFLAAALGLSIMLSPARAAEWQWSVPEGQARAYLWIPPDCGKVRGFVLANRNMLEESVLEHPVFRATLAELGLAEVWVVPGMGVKFDFNAGDEQKFERIVSALAEVSGYAELATAPVVTMGHSANATWVWNFAAWKPERTLAVLSIHGDAPKTALTGYGGENVCWGARTIDGVPGLLAISEQEWWEARVWPAMLYLIKHPKTPLALLCDAGNGHFNSSDVLVDYIALFLRKVVAARLADDGSLRPVDASTGWRLDRWRPGGGGEYAAPYGSYTGSTDEAFWCFDEEMANATKAYYARTRGKKPQLLHVGGQTGEPVEPKVELQEDGLTFRVETGFAEKVPDSRRCEGWTGLPAGSALGHGPGPVELKWISGPGAVTGPDTVRIDFDRADYGDSRGNEAIWLVASHPGGPEYRATVQQAMLRVPKFNGQPQVITFPEIPDQPRGAGPVKLQASTDAGLPVRYFVREGPAVIEGDTLTFTTIPPRALFPVSVTVVAWQAGRGTGPQVQRAVPVERTFRIVAAANGAERP